MEQNEGIIEITEIRNSGPGADAIGTLTARFVRYPGSQQLSLWLPDTGRVYDGSARILSLLNRCLIDENPVSDLLSGSIRMVWDTLPWPPGEYRIEIDHPLEGMHELLFKKWEEGALFPKDQIVEMPVVSASSLIQIEQVASTSDTAWHSYKDGNGREIPNTDQILREKMNREIRDFFKKLLGSSGPYLEYEGNFRGGNVIFVEGDLRIFFWHEMGGGDCQMYIDVPDETTWEQRTNTPVSRRDEILRFVANTVRREKAPSWRYEIGERVIAYY